MVTLEASVPVNGKIIIESSSPGAVEAICFIECGYLIMIMLKEYGWWWNYSPEEIEIIKEE